MFEVARLRSLGPEGIPSKEILRQLEFTNWSKSRKNAGVAAIEKKKDVQFAKEIFNAWDIDKDGYLTFNEITHHLIGLGLADTVEFVEKLLMQLKQKKRGGNQEVKLGYLTL